MCFGRRTATCYVDDTTEKSDNRLRTPQHVTVTSAESASRSSSSTAGQDAGLPQDDAGAVRHQPLVHSLLRAARPDDGQLRRRQPRRLHLDFLRTTASNPRRHGGGDVVVILEDAADGDRRHHLALRIFPILNGTGWRLTDDDSSASTMSTSSRRRPKRRRTARTAVLHRVQGSETKRTRSAGGRPRRPGCDAADPRRRALLSERIPGTSIECNFSTRLTRVVIDSP